MFAHQHSGGRRGMLVASAIAAVLLGIVGVLLIGSGLRGSAGPPPVAQVNPTPTATPAESATDPLKGDDIAAQQSQEPRDTRIDTADFGPVLAGSAPVALDIPSISVSSTNIVDLGLAPDGTLEVPSDASAPGWFTPGPTPGQFGPAIIVGHVDSVEGPAVFYRLGELLAGDRVKITREDGSVASFVIDRVESYDKADFPTREVYGTTKRAELRLITCSGEYDDELGYLGNTVAYAHLAAPTSEGNF